MIVDAHQHFWRLDRSDYGWLQPQLGILYRDYLPQDFEPLLGANDVGATVLVQAAATENETRYLLELATAHPFIAGVVGWVEFEADDAAQRMAALVACGHGRLKGLRPMLQDIADPQWILKPQLDAAFAAMIEQDLTFDALATPQLLRPVMERLRRHPDLRAIIDHAGKPDIAGGAFSLWAEDIARLAGETAACCKLSGLLTEAHAGAGVDALDRYVAHVFACFGPKRVVWGSDWPVLNRASDYGRWLAVARELVRRHAPGYETEVFGTNAIALYGLEAGLIATASTARP